MLMNEKEKEAIWYLKVLQQDYHHWQPECKFALDWAIKQLENKK